jgi:hypothetical protein
VTTPAQRLQLHEMMRQLLLNEPRVHYAQERPMETVKMAWPAALKRAQTTGLTMDCSEAATALCHWAGMKDPNGLASRISFVTWASNGRFPCWDLLHAINWKSASIPLGFKPCREFGKSLLDWSPPKR